MSRFRWRTASILMWQLSLLMPNSRLRKKKEAALALWTIFLLGRQAILGHAPPTYFRSMTAVFIPLGARVQDRSFPAAPLPNTSKSYSSGCDCVFCDFFDWLAFVVIK